MNPRNNIHPVLVVIVTLYLILDLGDCHNFSPLAETILIGFALLSFGINTLNFLEFNYQMELIN